MTVVAGGGRLWGMDTAAGLAASQELAGGATRVTELARALDGALRDFEWHGTDAERVRGSWDTVERPGLDATARHLTELALLIRQEAQAQDTASGESTGSPGGAGASGSWESPAPTGVLGILGGVSTWIGSRIDAVIAGLERTGGAALHLAGQVLDVVTGRADHPVAAIAASALVTVGSAAGTVANLVTGEDQRWFAEGEGLVGTPVVVPTDALRASLHQPVLTPPTDLPSLMQGVTDGYQVGAGAGSSGDVRITRVDNGTGTPAYVVAIPGTERWWPDAGSVERDLSANLHLMAGTPTAAAASVQRAMDAAGIPDGAPVLLVGHSQGGIIAGTLASDPTFAERYGQVSVMTYGAPIDHVRLDPSVQALALQHRFDVVPRLDLGGLDTSGSFPAGQTPGQTTGVTTVTLDSPGSVWDLGASHSQVAYRDSVREALSSDDLTGSILRDYQAALAPFLVAPGGSASAVDVPVSRGQD